MLNRFYDNKDMIVFTHLCIIAYTSIEGRKPVIAYCNYNVNHK